MWITTTRRSHSFLLVVACVKWWKDRINLEQNRISSKFQIWAHKPFVQWVSCQIRKIAGCACRDAGNVFPANEFKGNHQLAIPAYITARASRHVRDARAVMHVGIANPLWQENYPGIHGACATLNFTYLARGTWSSGPTPLTGTSAGAADEVAD